jgi:hypothetical protein
MISIILWQRFDTYFWFYCILDSRLFDSRYFWMLDFIFFILIISQKILFNKFSTVSVWRQAMVIQTFTVSRNTLNTLLV